MIGREEGLTTPEQVEATRVSAGQRRVNIIWERTQAVIALSVVGVALLLAAYIIATPFDIDRIAASPAFTYLVGASNLVIGFYFGRTNHQRIGGVGDQAPSEVVGR